LDVSSFLELERTLSAPHDVPLIPHRHRAQVLY
jgi:hypothetical protein